MNYLRWILTFLLIPLLICGEEEEDDKDKKDDKKEEKKDEPPKIGNFSLPVSQQPAALFGFGGNIIDKGETQVFLFSDEFDGCDKFLFEVIPSYLYGITDKFSIFFNLPYAPKIRDEKAISAGLEDAFIQFEYSFYDASTKTYTDQATFVTNVTFPTGSTHKDPPTGFGSESFFLGFTFYRTWVDWIAFTSHGVILPTFYHGQKFGDQYLYQFGIGKTICTPKGWIYAWMLELDGQYNKKNKGHNIAPNSGGNVLYLTPSLWISSKDVLVQFGISIPLQQNLFGKQRKFDYAFDFNFGWSFY